MNVWNTFITDGQQVLNAQILVSPLARFPTVCNEQQAVPDQNNLQESQSKSFQIPHYLEAFYKSYQFSVFAVPDNDPKSTVQSQFVLTYHNTWSR